MCVCDVTCKILSEVNNAKNRLKNYRLKTVAGNMNIFIAVL